MQHGDLGPVFSPTLLYVVQTLHFAHAFFYLLWILLVLCLCSTFISSRCTFYQSVLACLQISLISLFNFWYLSMSKTCLPTFVHQIQYFFIRPLYNFARVATFWQTCLLCDCDCCLSLCSVYIFSQMILRLRICNPSTKYSVWVTRNMRAEDVSLLSCIS